MRLLHTATVSDGKLRWTEDFVRSEDIPPYAILSHTWGQRQVIFGVEGLSGKDCIMQVTVHFLC
jgi:hypothetical protein